MRAVLIVAALAAFIAALAGVKFLIGGISPAFGDGFVCALGLVCGLHVFVIDADDVGRERLTNVIAFAILLTCAFGLGASWALHGVMSQVSIGAAVGAALFFPMMYWASGQDRIKRGVPRQKRSRA